MPTSASPWRSMRRAACGRPAHPVMSATLDGARVAALLNDAPVIASEGRAFPVETTNSERDPHRRIEESVTEAVMRAAPGRSRLRPRLPAGAGEIRRTAELLAARVGPEVDLAPLYGALTPAEQDRPSVPRHRAAQGGARHLHRRNLAHHRRVRSWWIPASPASPSTSPASPHPPHHGQGVAGGGGSAPGPRGADGAGHMLAALVGGGHRRARCLRSARNPVERPRRAAPSIARPGRDETRGPCASSIRPRLPPWRRPGRCSSGSAPWMRRAAQPRPVRLCAPCRYRRACADGGERRAGGAGARGGQPRGCAGGSAPSAAMPSISMSASSASPANRGGRAADMAPSGRELGAARRRQVRGRRSPAGPLLALALPRPGGPRPGPRGRIRDGERPGGAPRSREPADAGNVHRRRRPRRDGGECPYPGRGRHPARTPSSPCLPTASNRRLGELRSAGGGPSSAGGAPPWCRHARRADAPRAGRRTPPPRPWRRASPDLVSTGCPWTAALSQWRARIGFPPRGGGGVMARSFGRHPCRHRRDVARPAITGRTGLASITARRSRPGAARASALGAAQPARQRRPDPCRGAHRLADPVDYAAEEPSLSVRVQELFGLDRHPCAGGRPLVPAPPLPRRSGRSRSPATCRASGALVGGGARRDAGPLSPAPLARGSARGGSDPPGQATRNMNGPPGAGGHSARRAGDAKPRSYQGSSTDTMANESDDPAGGGAGSRWTTRASWPRRPDLSPARASTVSAPTRSTPTSSAWSMAGC